MTDMYGQNSTALQSALDAFHITDEDLIANRYGRFSPVQARRMLRSGTWNLIGAAFGAAVLALLVLAVANKPLKPVQWILSGLLAGGILLTGIVVNSKLRRSVSEGVVERHAGPVTINRQGKAGFFIAVNGVSFRLPVQPSALLNGAPYVLYVMPAAKRIIAMEPMDA
jgi:hypothetical protein